MERDLGLGIGGGHGHVALGLDVVVEVAHVAGVLKEVLTCVGAAAPLVGDVHGAVSVELDGQELILHGGIGVGDGGFDGGSLLFDGEGAVADAMGLYLHLHLKAVDVAGLTEAILGECVGELVVDEGEGGGDLMATFVEDSNSGGGIVEIQIHVGLDGQHRLIRLQGQHHDGVIAVDAVGLDGSGQMVQRSVTELLAAGGGLGEAGLHLLVDLVAGAGADGIVGVVLHELLPCVQEQILLVLAAAQVRQDGHGLGHPLQQVLGVVVHLLDVHVSRGGTDEGAGACGELTVDLALVDGEAVFVGSDGLQVVLEVGLLDLHLVLQGVGQLDGGLKVGLDGLVVTAVHAQQMGGEGEAGGGGDEACQAVAEGVLLGGKLHGVAVPAREHDGHDLRAVRSPPDQLGGGDAVLLDDLVVRAHVIEAAAEHGAVKAEPTDDLGGLGDVAEGIGEVARLHGLGTDGAAEAEAVEHIADIGLARGKVLVLQDVPRAHVDAAVANELCEAVPHVGLDLQVVVDDDVLAVHVVVGIVGVLFHDVDEGVEQLHEVHAVLLEGQVPLSVPVGVGDDVQDLFHG